MTEDNPNQSAQESYGSNCTEEKDIGELSASLNRDEKPKPLTLETITFNWGRNRTSDCEWRETYLNLYSDGSYDGNVNLRCNKGSFFTCTLGTGFEVKVGETVIYSFDAPTREVAGADDTDTRFNGSSPAIAANFSRINTAMRVRRARNC